MKRQRQCDDINAMRSLSVVHTVSSLDAAAAGPSYTVPRLVRELAAQGHRASVLTLGKNRSECDTNGIVTRLPPDRVCLGFLRRLGRSRALRDALFASDAEVFHGHGLWMMPNVYPGNAARSLMRPFVLAPRGMLGRDALKFSMRRKRLFWGLWQSTAIAAVSCFHATAESEYQDIRDFGLRHPVAIVPNGVDLPELGGSPSRLVERGVPYILSLGRIHPKKGLDQLVAAFALVALDYPKLRLRIVGPDEGGYAARLLVLAADLGLEDRVTIEGPVFGREKEVLMSGALVFCLPTLHENFAMTVAESLSLQTPVISTKGAPWEGLIAHRCGWWVDHGPSAIAVAMREALNMPSAELFEMGKRGRLWMAEEFGWEGVAIRMTSVYSWLLGLAPRPSCVRL